MSQVKRTQELHLTCWRKTVLDYVVVNSFNSAAEIWTVSSGISFKIVPNKHWNGEETVLDHVVVDSFNSVAEILTVWSGIRFKIVPKKHWNGGETVWIVWLFISGAEIWMLCEKYIMFQANKDCKGIQVMALCTLLYFGTRSLSLLQCTMLAWSIWKSKAQFSCCGIQMCWIILNQLSL